MFRPTRIPYLLFLLLILLIGNPSYGQSEAIDDKGPVKLSQLYLFAGYGADFSNGDAKNGSFGTAFMLSNHWGGSIEFNEIGYTSLKLPADYKPGGPCIFGCDIPKDWVHSLSFCVAREKVLTEDGTFRLGLEAGPALVDYQYKSFIPQAGFPNYSESKTDEISVGLTLKARAQLVSRVVGVESAIFSNINQYHSTIGLNFNLMLGHLREWIKPKRAGKKQGYIGDDIYD